MLQSIENTRRDVSSSLDDKTRSRLGQFFTPQSIARFMASLFQVNGKESISLLDAGAGIGSLSAAFLERMLSETAESLEVLAYEVDKDLTDTLSEGLDSYKSRYKKQGKHLNIEVVNKDFIQHAVIELCMGRNRQFDFAILNPPYCKINSNSTHRRLLRKQRIETVNLYSAFVALSLKLLAPGGQVVAIIPRSFCNGPYYKSFRELLLSSAAVNHIHLFDARDKAFEEDGVLQENIILHLTRGAIQKSVTISTSADGQFDDYREWKVPFAEVVKPGDAELFIHVPHHSGTSLLNDSGDIRYALSEIGCMVSTGPVVDFRVKEYLRKMPGEHTAPLIYPAHFNGWTIHYPLEGFKKFNAIEVNEETARQLYPAGNYVIVRRFSSKEEKRRIVARVVRPEDTNSDWVGFENHLNVFHFNKAGLPEELAYGLAAYLNSSQVDEYFRVFSGHTQVNATDLRTLKYPSRQTLVQLGKWAKTQTAFNPDQIDDQVAEIL